MLNKLTNRIISDTLLSNIDRAHLDDKLTTKKFLGFEREREYHRDWRVDPNIWLLIAHRSRNRVLNSLIELSLFLHPRPPSLSLSLSSRRSSCFPLFCLCLKVESCRFLPPHRGRDHPLYSNNQNEVAFFVDPHWIWRAKR